MRKRTLVLSLLLGLAALVVIVNWTWGNLPGEPPARGERATLGDVEVRYVERPGDGPAVLLLHGLPGTAEDFARVTPLLSRAGMRTVALDRPGFGFSEGGYHPLGAQLAAIEALLDQLAIDRVVLVGHSYGGTIALAFAARHPERVRGLVLVDAAAAGQRTGTADRAQARFLQLLSWPVVQPLARVTFGQAALRASADAGAKEAFAPDPVDPAYTRRLLAVTMQQSDLDALAGEQLAANREIERIDRRLGGIRTPAVVIQAGGDRLVKPAFGRRLAAELPRARLVETAGGHMVPLVHPQLVAQAARSCAAGCGTH
jgi:pimeloyl-ACP methyl ester carboxylesterase